ncbi:terpene synthase family protein [Algoriphagus litoralis]|uniref:terpene synthase family protein n=1 Tax=Algoriphagus litoralis TaxID=2202829 RepID=UPI000DBA30E1|nr:terpene synthase family protein [Algoriphagus litoralis]
MNNSVFPSALHSSIRELDEEVLRWAWSAGLFESPAELERCRIQKINWFAGYLFPGESAEKLRLTIRFFLCLFLLDDLLDQISESESFGFLRGLMLGSVQSEIPRLQNLGSELILTHELLGNSSSSAQWRKEWLDIWTFYISGLNWEVKNKTWGQKPDLEDYRYHRPSSSGVFLAIHLIRPDLATKVCEAELLEHAIARLICLSNDLASFEKELAIGDFHNELIILQPTMGDQVKSWAAMEIRSIQKRIHILASSVASHSDSCRSWVESLFLLVGGCLAWSEETTRYVSYVNGTLRAN